MYQRLPDNQEDATYHFNKLRIDHLKREQRVTLFVKLAELLASEDGEK